MEKLGLTEIIVTAAFFIIPLYIAYKFGYNKGRLKEKENRGE